MNNTLLSILCVLSLISNLCAQTCTTKSSLNVRSCASPTCRVVKVLPQGATVPFTSATTASGGHNWMSIGSEQWISTSYLSCPSRTSTTQANPTLPTRSSTSRTPILPATTASRPPVLPATTTPTATAVPAAKYCLTTSDLNVRSCAGTNCGVVRTIPTGSAVTMTSGVQANGGLNWVSIGTNQWVATSYLRCSTTVQQPTAQPTTAVSANPSASTSLSSYGTTYVASGFTFTGRKAQLLNMLKARFGCTGTTYNGHSEGPLGSSDLWTVGARGGRDNSDLPAMNEMATFLANNRAALGVSYVIWRQRICSDRQCWRTMEDRGGLTQNHFDHVHITFR